MYQAIPPKNPKEGMYGISTAMLLSTHEKRVRRGSRCTWCRGSGLEEDCFDSVQHCTAGMKGGGACTEDGREAAPALGRKGMRCLRGSRRMRWEALAPPPVRDERRRRRSTRQQGEAAREPLEKRRREAARSDGKGVATVDAMVVAKECQVGRRRGCDPIFIWTRSPYS
uniref:Uncharacterized protein n=1 Tax=Oryza rufipogon TaxID=4529 RepID=A0A0E0PJE2_ORYRU